MNSHSPGATLEDALRDSRAAAAAFVAGALCLLLGATLGLNAWPLQEVLNAAATGQGKNVFLALHGYSPVLLLLFWGARPSTRDQWLCLGFGMACMAAFWWAFDKDLNFTWTDPKGFPVSMLVTVSLSLPGLVLLAWRCTRWGAYADAPFESQLRWLLLLSVLFLMVPSPALSLNAALHPLTYDAFALRWDAAAGLGITPGLSRFIEAVPGLPQAVGMAYGLTPLGFLAAALLHLRGRPAHVPSALLMWVVLTLCALVAYNFLPITGPKYVFGSDHFLSRLAQPEGIPLAPAAVPPFPRNGMPSMHFGWMLAATLLWWQSGTRWHSRALLVLTTTLTALATLYLGEHYLVDLVVAVPFVLAVMGLCARRVPWASAARRGIVAWGFGTWLVWVLLIRHATAVFLDHPALCWLLIAATVAVVVQQSRWMARLRLDVNLPRPAAAAPLAADQAALQRRFGLMFFFSGMAALVYQVLFAKELALVFGSTATATFTVLATFLGGMAIGSVIGGAWAHRLAQPLRSYALVEVGIALYCVATPALFRLVQSAYVASATGMDPGAASLLVLRVLLGAAVLLPPTVLMGATLPLLAQAVGPQGGRLGLRVAGLYYANTAGAALGALLGAYAVIPLLGVQRSTFIAAMLNLLVALGALELAKRWVLHRAAEAAAALPAAGQAAASTPSTASSVRLRAAALLALGVGGVLSLGLEVVYVHMLAIVAGNSVYAFGLMVATFLVGLSLGGQAGRALLARSAANAPAALAWSLLGLSLAVSLGALMWNGIPDYFASFAGHPLARSFGAREAIRALVCALVMVPPTLFIGMAYVLAMDIVTAADAAGGGDNTRALGLGAGINTLGNIVGVLLFGFVLLPALGGLRSGAVIAAAALLLAGAVALLAPRTVAVPRWRGALAAVLSAAAVGFSAQWTVNYESLSSGANVYFHAQQWGRVIDHAESIDGGLTAVTRSDTPAGPMHTLLTNGKFQGNDALAGEMQAQLGFAFAPLLHQGARERALIIGYGTGVTSRVFHEAGFKTVEIAELSRDIVRLADQHFERVSRGVSRGPGVALHYTDGRNLLLLSPHRYDVISLEITSIWFAGAASLYNREFYALARSKMSPGGVLQQWMQLHHLNATDLLHIVASIRSQFRYVSLYVLGGQGILVATNDASRADVSAPAVQLLAAQPALADARALLGRELDSLRGERLLDAAGIDRFLAGTVEVPEAWISTDDNLRLEYDTPKGNANDGEKSLANNMALLQRFAKAPAQPPQ